jgi:hypothetical protein
MSLEKLYSINSEINNMLGGEMTGGDSAIWSIIMLLIITVVGIILYLSGILSFNKPSFVSSHVDKQVVETQIIKKAVQSKPEKIKKVKTVEVAQDETETTAQTPRTQSPPTPQTETQETPSSTDEETTQTQTKTKTQTETPVTQTQTTTENETPTPKKSK